MLAKLSSYTLIGIDAAPVEVEVDVSAASMPKMVLVGWLLLRQPARLAHRVERAAREFGVPAIVLIALSSIWRRQT